MATPRHPTSRGVPDNFWTIAGFQLRRACGPSRLLVPVQSGIVPVGYRGHHPDDKELEIDVTGSF